MQNSERQGKLVEKIPAKTIVTRAKNTAWFGIEYNMNIYKGCCHGCIYCDSRSDCYGIEEFDRVRVKDNALEIIRNDLRRKVKTGVVGTGAMSDPYNPFEKELMLTGHALELLDAYKFGVSIATKSSLILRDIPILQQIQEHSPVLCKVTVTTCDDELCRKLEPNVCPSSERFEALNTLTEAGLFTGILMMPVLPFLEDNEKNILEIVRRAGECGVRFIYPAFGMTLRDNQRQWYYDKLEQLFPDQNLKEQYIRRYSNVYECISPRSGRLWKAFAAECERLGILYQMKDIVRAYRQGYGSQQLSLF